MHTDALICGILSVLSLACLRMAVTPVFFVLGLTFGLIAVAIGTLSRDRLAGKIGASLGLIGVLASLVFFLLLPNLAPRVSPTQVPTSATTPAR